MGEKKEPLVGFIGGSYRDNNQRYDCQQTINYYTQQDEAIGGKERQVTELLQRPGLTLVQTLSPGPIRAMYGVSNNGEVVIVSGNQVYVLSGVLGIPVNIAGTMGTDSGYCSITDNGGYVMIVDGTTTYYTFQLGTTTLQALTNDQYPGGTTVVYQDGFFLGCQPLTPNIWSSANTAPEGGGAAGGPIAWPSSGLGENIGVKQGYADIVNGLLSNSRELFVQGTQTGEVWNNELASAVFTFVREDGKNSQVGCLAQFTFVQLAGTMFWVGSNPQGGAVVYMMNGYTPQRVSTHAVEFALSQLGDLSNSIAFGMQYQGHYFYVLQATGSKTTWVYDVSGISDSNPQNGLWTEWTTTQANNTQGPWLPSFHATLNGSHLLGDSSNGNIYLWDPTATRDNGATMLRRRRSPHFSKNLNHCFYGLLQIDFLMGQGLVNDGVNTDNNVNPQAVLRTSDDGGQSFDLPMYAELGAIGQFKARARWAQLGESYDRVFEVEVTDDVIAHMIIAMIQMEVGEG